MNVSDVSSNFCVAPSTALPSQTPVAGATQTERAAQDGDDQRVHHHRGHHGGGRMMGALTQSLESLGIALPQAGGSSSSTSAPGSDGQADDGKSTAASSIRADMRSFMHALFQALRGESSSGSDDGTDKASSTSSSDRRAGFASDLSALIAQVGNGSAPSELQSAFGQLMSDLGAKGSAGTASADNGTENTDGSPATITLQQLLTQMQQRFGYAPGAMGASTGNTVGTTA